MWPFRRHQRSVGYAVFCIDLNPCGFNEAESAVWMDAMRALNEFCPDGQGGAA